MTHKLGICIPYRNRKEHLEQLIPHLDKFLTERGINHNFYVGHQVDDKLLNRGSMKNIAAKFAFEDGCDYVAWHDVDMLPHDDCDYSYPDANPTHIATKLSKYNYGLSYDQYFGGVILFTKEQIEQINGYSNGYWDWGQEDDDLFWRCYYEGHTTGKIFKSYQNKLVANLNGDNSYLSLPISREVSSCLNDNHTISVLFKAQQQPEKIPIWLVGDKNKRFVEYPILRKDKSGTWGLSFNNSRAITMLLFDKNNGSHYNWGKRFENLWTWVTMRWSKEEKQVYFYINDDLTCQMDGIKQNKPFPIREELKSHTSVGNLILGHCPQMRTYLKGQIGEIKILNDDNDIVLHNDFKDGILGESHNVDLTIEDVEVIENILPHRREGSLLCLEHPNEGFVGGNWAKGETTARNEKRLVTQIQQRKIDYKKDGMNNILDVTEVVSVDKTTYPKTFIINTKMI